MIACLIIGELSTVELLCDYIDGLLKTKLVGSYLKMPASVSELLTLKPDIVFVDLKFARSNESLIGRIQQFATLVIISENKNDTYYALEYLAFDCLIKQFSFSRFEKSITKFEHLQQLIQSRQGQRTALEETFLIKTDSKGIKKVMVHCNELLYIKALQNYVILNMVNGEQLICYYTMKEMEIGLADFNFIRVHKSFLISASKITSIDANSIFLGEKDAKEILIGNTYRNSFFEKMNLKGIRKFLPEDRSLDLAKTSAFLLFYLGIIPEYIVSVERLTDFFI